MTPGTPLVRLCPEGCPMAVRRHNRMEKRVCVSHSDL
jgi:hypothetical protein